VIKAVFFDLDGTFADTAPDLAYAVNRMRETRGLPPLPLEVTRPVTSLGARGLLGKAFQLAPEDSEFQAMRKEFLAIYERDICRESRLFAGMEEALEGIESRGLLWGIVTNKSEALARLLLGKLGVAARAVCIVGGDTAGHTKPHPAPLLAACRAAGVDGGSCLYVGDDERDIVAGRAAGMKTIAAMWGYLNGSDPGTWGADWSIAQPRDLLALL
jgi:phosphoglycolate phosphatase